MSFEKYFCEMRIELALRKNKKENIATIITRQQLFRASDCASRTARNTKGRKWIWRRVTFRARSSSPLV